MWIPQASRYLVFSSSFWKIIKYLRILLGDSRAEKHFRCQPGRNTTESTTSLSLMLRLWYAATTRDFSTVGNKLLSLALLCHQKAILPQTALVMHIQAMHNCRWLWDFNNMTHNLHTLTQSWSCSLNPYHFCVFCEVSLNMKIHWTSIISKEHKNLSLELGFVQWLR